MNFHFNPLSSLLSLTRTLTSSIGVKILVVIWLFVFGILHAPSTGSISNFKTIMIKSIRISFIARCCPGHTLAPLPNARYPLAGVLCTAAALSLRKRVGSKSEAVGPQATSLLCSSADGIKRIAFFFRRYVSSSSVSSRTTRPEALVLWTRRTSLTSEVRGG